MKKYIQSTITLVIIALVLTAYYVYGHWNSSDADAAQTLSSALPAPSGPVDPELLSKPADPPPGYVKYHNDRYGFSFYHGPNGKVTEFDEGQGAMTVVLENEVKVRGMQIFVVPYPDDKISEERFRADVPSGVRTNVENAFIGLLGVQAVTFNSYDSFLGDTREVWFIHDHLLFEVTTFKGVGDWFTPIMQTWRFK